jgi:hypothetical protein
MLLVDQMVPCYKAHINQSQLEEQTERSRPNIRSGPGDSLAGSPCAMETPLGRSCENHITGVERGRALNRARAVA